MHGSFESKIQQDVTKGLAFDAKVDLNFSSGKSLLSHLSRKLLYFFFLIIHISTAGL